MKRTSLFPPDPSGDRGSRQCHAGGHEFKSHGNAVVAILDVNQTSCKLPTAIAEVDERRRGQQRTFNLPSKQPKHKKSREKAAENEAGLDEIIHYKH